MIRPCVQVNLGNLEHPRYRWVPIIGPIHDDLEIIGFKEPHVHADWRYCSNTLIRALEPDLFDEPVRRLAARLASQVFSIETPPRNERTDGVISQRQFRLNPDTQDWPSTLRGEDVDPWQPWPAKAWPHRLGVAYASHRINPAHPVCPHRGAPLCGVTPDADGIITCPAHGLRWDAKTGEARPRPPHD